MYDIGMHQYQTLWVLSIWVWLVPSFEDFGLQRLGIDRVLVLDYVKIQYHLYQYFDTIKSWSSPVFDTNTR